MEKRETKLYSDLPNKVVGKVQQQKIAHKEEKTKATIKLGYAALRLKREQNKSAPNGGKGLRKITPALQTG